MGKKNIVWNDYISQDERFADFFNGVLFQGEKIVDPEALTELDSKLWWRNREKDSYHEYVRDNVKMFGRCLEDKRKKDLTNILQYAIIQ